VIALAEAADYDRAVRLVADQPDVRDVEDAGDLLGDDGKELIGRGFARDEGRDLPQGGLFGNFLRPLRNRSAATSMPRRGRPTDDSGVR
jgi:hypothetical protein